MTDDDQERERLFHDVWGDAAVDRPRSPRRGPGVPSSEEGQPAATLQPPGANPANLILEVGETVRQLRLDLEATRRMTEEGLAEMRATMLRLAEAVQALQRRIEPSIPPGPRFGS
jgi:hypothetical protein